MNEEQQPPTIKSVLEKTLVAWVEEKSKNGINQHCREWLESKIYTCSGTSMAVLQGKNPYQTIPDWLGQKIGLYPFKSDIAPQWGNLFEPMIQKYVERDRKCKILGEDLYVIGKHPAVSYSPDGLAVMDVTETYMIETETEMTPHTLNKTTTVLLEFKCPYSRIPNGRPPTYYIPQVKMGLEVLEIPTIGLFVEAVFRRCTWDQLGPGPEYDRTLVPKSSGKNPLAYGLIGFYYDDAKFHAMIQDRIAHNEEVESILQQKDKLIKQFKEFYIEYGDETNEHFSNDLGEAPVDLFKLVMSSFDKRILIPNYVPMFFTGGESLSDKYGAVDIAANSHVEFCAEGNFWNFGILPWKLFRVDYHYIQKDLNYLDPWMTKIEELIGVVRECMSNPDKKKEIYTKYISRSMSCGFSDEL